MGFVTTVTMIELRNSDENASDVMAWCMQQQKHFHLPTQSLCMQAQSALDHIGRSTQTNKQTFHNWIYPVDIDSRVMSWAPPLLSSQAIQTRPPCSKNQSLSPDAII